MRCAVGCWAAAELQPEHCNGEITLQVKQHRCATGYWTAEELQPEYCNGGSTLHVKPYNCAVGRGPAEEPQLEHRNGGVAVPDVEGGGPQTGGPLHAEPNPSSCPEQLEAAPQHVPHGASCGQVHSSQLQ